jgi:CCR4-NOT transcriptional regulation complex NOT5 subunit
VFPRSKTGVTSQQMERFKACEKEMKTKAFSKEGLNAQTKLDPKEQLKLETSGWVSNLVDELGRQIELAEAEIENIRGGGKRKKDQRANDRVLDLEGLNDRRKWHVSRLEIILRLLENGNLDPDQVTTLRDDINYFVETNTVNRILGLLGFLGFVPLTGCERRRISRRTKASMTNSTWKKRRRLLV